MEGSAPIRIGIIGTGFGAHVHLPAFRQLPGVEVLGIAGRDPRHTEAVVGRCKGLHAYASADELLADERITAVSVAVPPAMHREVVLAAIRRGKHVLCEKPLGLSPVEAAEMLTAATTVGIVHAVDFMFRLAPAWHRAKELLAAHAIGELVRVNVEWTIRGRADRDPRWCWQFDPATGGGTLFAFGSHVIDYLEWLAGPVEAVSAHHSTRCPVGGRETAEDTCDVMLLLQDDIPISVTISTATPGGRGHWVTLYGTHGVLAIGNANLGDIVAGTRLYLTGPESNEPRLVSVEPLPIADGEDGRVALVRRVAGAFVEAVRARCTVPPSFREGWRAQVVMGAIRRSHEARRWVRVDAASLAVPIPTVASIPQVVPS